MDGHTAVHLWDYRNRKERDYSLQGATFTNERLPHIPTLSAPPAPNKAPDPPERPYGGPTRPPTTDRTFRDATQLKLAADQTYAHCAAHRHCFLQRA